MTTAAFSAAPLTSAASAGTRLNGAKEAFAIGPIARSLVSVAGFAMTFLCLIALGRGALGLVPNLEFYNKLPIVIHVATVLPCIPLGLYVLLAGKGTPRHRMLGKVWLLLMLATATSAIFIQSSGGFSPIHIFVPITFHAAWKTVATARKGDIAGHKKHLVTTYLTALMIPGIAAFAIPGRLMNVMMFG